MISVDITKYLLEPSKNFLQHVVQILQQRNITYYHNRNPKYSLSCEVVLRISVISFQKYLKGILSLRIIYTAQLFSEITGVYLGSLFIALSGTGEDNLYVPCLP